MKVYVDELPKHCLECGFCCKDDLGYWCQGRESIGGVFIADEMCVKQRLMSCPLQSLTDYTKKVRKEVIGQVRDIARKIARPTTEYDGGEFDYDVDGVTLDNLLIWLEDEEFDLLKNFLDQIQGETKC